MWPIPVKAGQRSGLAALRSAGEQCRLQPVVRRLLFERFASAVPVFPKQFLNEVQSLTTHDALS